MTLRWPLRVVVICCVAVAAAAAASLAAAAAAADATEDSAEFRALLKDGDKLVMGGRASYGDAVAKFSQALELVPTSVKARFRRAELMYLQRQFDRAQEDLDAVLRADPAHRRALETRIKVSEATGRVSEAVADWERLAHVHRAQGHADKAAAAFAEAARRRSVVAAWEALQRELPGLRGQHPDARRGLCEQCVRVIRELIELTGGGSKIDLRLKLAECAVLGRLHGAANDELKVILRLQPSSLEAAALHASELRALGSMDRARAEIRRCLRLDPEYAPCMDLHRAMKRYTRVADVLEKHIADREWLPAMAHVDTLLGLGADEAPNVEQLWRWKCEGYAALRDVTNGMTACDTVIQLEDSEGGDKNPRLVDPLLWRADLHVLNDDLDAASRDVNRAGEVTPDSQRVREYRDKMEKLRRQGQRKDYYKILGVPKTASDADIRKAYRVMSRQYHPDLLRSKQLSDAERTRFDKLYRDCNEAKEMLMDAEKRRRYDAGEDPTKPPEQQGGHHHHHGGGGFQFHGFPGGGFPGGGGGGGMPGGFQFHFG